MNLAYVFSELSTRPIEYYESFRRIAIFDTNSIKTEKIEEELELHNRISDFFIEALFSLYLAKAVKFFVNDIYTLEP